MSNLCPVCKTPLKKGQKFCSVSCSNKNRTRTEESKEKTRNSLKKNFSKLNWITCKTDGCNNISLKERNRPVFCKECLSHNLRSRGRNGGKISAKTQANERRSNPEKQFFRYISRIFKDALSNEVVIDGWDADIIIPSIKYTIHWNGRWHYEKLGAKHSPIQVQNRDFLKTKLFEKEGWKSIHIRDLQEYQPKHFLRILITHIKNNYGSSTIFKPL